MIRKVYIDFIKNKVVEGKWDWFFKRFWQYFIIHISFIAGRPFCGPILGTFVVNYRCNYKCKMCDLPLRDKFIQKQGLKEFSTLQLKKILKEFASLGTAGIGFTGGEPLLREDIFELMKYSKELGMITHLNTNGFFLDSENIKRLLYANVDSINISLDGAYASTHDAIRGYRGAFDRVVYAVECIDFMRKKMGVPIRVKVVTVIGKDNIDEIPDLFKLAHSLKVDCIEFIPQQPFSVLTDDTPVNFDNIFLEKIDTVVDYILKEGKKIVRVENSPRHLKLFKNSFGGEKSPLICFAGYNSYAVDCYGQIFPCMPWVNWGKSVGNVKESSLKKFWYSAMYNKIRRDISKCRDCYLNCQAELNILFNII